MNKKTDDTDKIVEKYKRIEKMNTLITISSVTLIPLVAIFFNIAMRSSNSVLRSVAQVIGISTIILILIFYIIGRRCPNCHRRLNKYVIMPKSCPYCKVKYRK